MPPSSTAANKKVKKRSTWANGYDKPAENKKKFHFFSYRKESSLKPSLDALHILRVKCDPGRVCAKKYECSECVRLFDSSKDVERHLRQEHKFAGNYVCHMCNQRPTFNLTKGMKHMLDVHFGQELKPPCIIQEVDDDELSDDDEAKSEVMNTPRHIRCAFCEHSSATAYAYKRHLKLCIDYKSYACGYCTFKSHFKRDMVRHLKRSHIDLLDSPNPADDTKPTKLEYQCQVSLSIEGWLDRFVERYVIYRQLLDQERLFRSDEFDETQNYSCNICAKYQMPPAALKAIQLVYYTPQSLRAHLANHFFYRPYRCSAVSCKSDFTTADQAMRHHFNFHLNYRSQREYTFTPIQKLERYLDYLVKNEEKAIERRQKCDYRAWMNNRSLPSAPLPLKKTGILKNANSICHSYEKLYREYMEQESKRSSISHSSQSTPDSGIDDSPVGPSDERFVGQSHTEDAAFSYVFAVGDDSQADAPAYVIDFVSESPSDPSSPGSDSNDADLAVSLSDSGDEDAMEKAPTPVSIEKGGEEEDAESGPETPEVIEIIFEDESDQEECVLSQVELETDSDVDSSNSSLFVSNATRLRRYVKLNEPIFNVFVPELNKTISMPVSSELFKAALQPAVELKRDEKLEKRFTQQTRRHVDNSDRETCTSHESAVENRGPQHKRYKLCDSDSKRSQNSPKKSKLWDTKLKAFRPANAINLHRDAF